MFSYTLTPSSINLCIDNKVSTIDSTHINYQTIRNCIRDHGKEQVGLYQDLIVTRIRELLDVKAFVAKFTEGAVQVGETDVLLHGQPVHGTIAERLIGIVNEGFSPAPLARFLEKLQSNPAEHARTELYLWLETSKLPICDDGDFLAFKKVRDDYKSHHDKMTDNSVGTTLEMPRENVDPVRDNTCSSGYHFCSLNYLSAMGSGRTVICKINPADVVTIPSDYSNQKGRAWRYTIIDEVATEQASTYYSGVPLVSVVQADEGAFEVAPSIGISADVTTSVGLDETTRAFLNNAFKDKDSLTKLRAAANGDYDAINCFMWYDSPQGHAYWADIWFEECVPDAARAILKSWIEYLDAVNTPAPAPTVEDVVANTPTLIHHEHELPKKPDPTYGAKFELSFTKGDHTITLKDLKAMLVEHGERGTSRLTGIPRTTLQSWREKYNLG